MADDSLCTLPQSWKVDLCVSLVCVCLGHMNQIKCFLGTDPLSSPNPYFHPPTAWLTGSETQRTLD